MNIGIDGRPMEGNIAGIGRYVLEICRELDRQLPEARFYVYSRGEVNLPQLSDRWTFRTEPRQSLRKLKSVAWLKLRLPRLAASDGLDVFFAGASFVPRLGHRVASVSVVHDLNHLLVPETLPRATLVAYKLFFRSDVERATLVVSNSRGTADRLRHLLGIESAAVAIPGVGPLFQVPSGESVTRARAALKLASPYVLALGTREPRKNLHLLVETFCELRRAGELPGFELLIAGGSGWKSAALEQAIDLGAPLGVRRLGFVPDEFLPALYRSARLFAFPSVYEGYGIPVAEAIACGARVLATDLPELREAGGASAAYTSLEPEALRRALLTLTGESPARAVTDPCAGVGWDRTGAAIASALREAVRRKREVR